MRNIFRYILLGLAGAVLLASCANVRNFSYLQDLQPGVPLAVQELQQLTLQPGDRIQITVFSRDKELTELFNLYDQPNGGGGSNGRYHAYTVRTDGTVELPTLGPVKVQGLTRQEVADQIKYMLLSSKLLLDPTVIVEYYDLSFYALGELGRHGRIEIPTDHITLLEAISLAGDLTTDGKRENVLVLRTENGIQTPYTVDLTNTRSIYGSPVYYIRQNDVIYVEPNQKKALQSDQNASTLRSLGFWMGLPSYITSLVLIITQFTKK
jgi:polysaccharide export outer membrane protein